MLRRFFLFILLGSLKELRCILLSLLFPECYEIRMHTVECCQLLNRLLSLDCFKSNLRLEFLVIVFAHNELYASFFILCKKVRSTLFFFDNGLNSRAHYNLIRFCLCNFIFAYYSKQRYIHSNRDILKSLFSS